MKPCWMLLERGEGVAGAVHADCAIGCAAVILLGLRLLRGADRRGGNVDGLEDFADLLKRRGAGEEVVVEETLLLEKEVVVLLHVSPLG